MTQATAPMVPMNHGWRMNSFILYHVSPEPPRASTILTSPLELSLPGWGLTPPNKIPAAEEKRNSNYICMTENAHLYFRDGIKGYLNQVWSIKIEVLCFLTLVQQGWIKMMSKNCCNKRERNFDVRCQEDGREKTNSKKTLFLSD